MNDELVKRLRANTSWGDDRFAEAADRIEALTAEREALEQDNHRWKMECENFWRDREKALTADFARQVQRTDEQREAYEQALSVMEAERDRLREALRCGQRLWEIARDDRIRLLIQLEQCEKRND